MENTKKTLEQLLDQIEALEQTVMEQSKYRWDHIAKPINGLGRMEKLITKIAGIQGSENVDLSVKKVIVMCSDNGIVEEGVTQTDQSVTAIVTENFAKGITSVNRMAAYAGAEVLPVDIGVVADLFDRRIKNCKVAYGTRNFTKEPAMTEQEMLNAIFAGIAIVRECKEQGTKIIATGEMGIGNTTTSSAIASVLLDLPVEKVTGPGAGLSKEGILRKVEVIKKGIKLHAPDKNEPLQVLRCLGGYDIAGMTGLFIGGALYHIPVIIDGLISSLSALIAVRLCGKIADYVLPSHMGKEPSCKKIMEELGLHPVIEGELALGEGTGAVMMFPLLDMANEVYMENSTFDDIEIDAYENFNSEEVEN